MPPELTQELLIQPILIGCSQAAMEMRQFAARAGMSEQSVLLLGETGAGKDQLAEFIHFAGRPRKKFVPVDCGGMSEALNETELFGHVPGAYTDAKTFKQGLVQVAENGTLFFNEIGNMPLALQAKFLRVLEKKSFRQVGGVQELVMNTRIIAATNMDLEAAVRDGKMRLDLFHRLSIIVFTVPPLRERPDDIPVLANYFLKKEGPEKTFSEEALSLLIAYDWPGNVRELRNVVARAVFNSQEESTIQREHIQLFNRAASVPALQKGIVWPTEMPSFEGAQESYFRELLKRNPGNQKVVAEKAGVTPSILKFQINKYGLENVVDGTPP